MSKIFTPPKITMSQYGKIMVATKSPEEFEYLIGKCVNNILLFDEGSDALLEQGETILPRYYYIFVGTKDNEPQYKPYEYDPYRIVIATYKDVIIKVESIG